MNEKKESYKRSCGYFSDDMMMERVHGYKDRGRGNICNNVSFFIFQAGWLPAVSMTMFLLERLFWVFNTFPELVHDG